MRLNRIIRRMERMLRQQSSREENSLAAFDYSTEEWKDNERCVHSVLGKTNKPNRVNWFLLPHLGHPMGGMSTVYRLAAIFAEAYGSKNTFIYCQQPSFSADEARAFLGPLVDKANIDVICVGTESIGWKDVIPSCDIAIGTRWDTTYPLLRFNKTKAKWYLLQDFDALFYPAGINRTLAEHTYSFGFTGLANSVHLAERYRTAGNVASHFIPLIDRERYAFKPQYVRPAGVVRVFFYARPGVVQNGFELGVATIRELKKRYGDSIEILTAGREWDERKYGLQGLVTNRGLIEDARELTAFYQSCHIGLIFTFTEGFPLIALECLSTGMALVVNKNPAHVSIWGERNAAAEVFPTLHNVVDGLERLVNDSTTREQMASNGQLLLDALDLERKNGLSEEAVVGRLLA